MIAFESQATTNEIVEVWVSLVRHFGRSDFGEEPSTKASPVLGFTNPVGSSVDER